MTSFGPKTELGSVTLCEIIREPGYEGDLSLISKDLVRLDELESAIDWALARNPEFFDHLGNNDYLWKTAKLHGFPEMRIVYHYNKESNTVHLLSIEAIKG